VVHDAQACPTTRWPPSRAGRTCRKRLLLPPPTPLPTTGCASSRPAANCPSPATHAGQLPRLAGRRRRAQAADTVCRSAASPRAHPAQRRPPGLRRAAAARSGPLAPRWCSASRMPWACRGATCCTTTGRQRPRLVCVMLHSAAQCWLQTRPGAAGRDQARRRRKHPAGHEAMFEVRAFVPTLGIARPVTGSLNASVAQWLIGAGWRRRPTWRRRARRSRAPAGLRRQVGDTVWVGGDIAAASKARGAVTVAVDHLVVAAATLEQGVAWCEAKLGVTPGPGGKHALSHPQPGAQIARRLSRCLPGDHRHRPAAPAPGRARWFARRAGGCSGAWPAAAAGSTWWRAPTRSKRTANGWSRPAWTPALRLRATAKHPGHLVLEILVRDTAAGLRRRRCPRSSSGKAPTRPQMAWPAWRCRRWTWPVCRTPRAMCCSCAGVGCTAAPGRPCARCWHAAGRGDAGVAMTEELFRDTPRCCNARPPCWLSTTPASCSTAPCSTRSAAGRRRRRHADCRSGAVLAIATRASIRRVPVHRHVPAEGSDTRPYAGHARGGGHRRTRRRAHMRFHTATHLLCALVPHRWTAARSRRLRAAGLPHERAAGQAGAQRRHRAPGGRGAPVRHRWISEDELDATRSSCAA